MVYSYFKYFLIIPVFFLIIIGCNYNDQSNKSELKNNNSYLVNTRNNREEDSVKIKFATNTTVDFGTIKAGDTIKRVFAFKNIGKKPFIIHEISAFCGCTVAYFNQSPLAIGETDSIIVRFVSDKDMFGFQSKVITVKCNSLSSPYILTINGSIE